MKGNFKLVIVLGALAVVLAVAGVCILLFAVK